MPRCKLLILTALSACAAAPSPTQPDAYTAMAFNVLYDGADDDASVAAIRAADPHVICLREVRPPFVRRFTAELAGKFLFAEEPRSPRGCPRATTGSGC